MELPNDGKIEVIRASIAEARKQQFKQELWGRAWQKLGNQPNAEACAKAVVDAAQVIDSFEEELKALEELA